jgi:hypothetical protein
LKNEKEGKLPRRLTAQAWSPVESAFIQNIKLRTAFADWPEMIYLAGDKKQCTALL